MISYNIYLSVWFISLSIMFFFSSYVWMWELDNKEGWALKSWCFWIMALEKIFENPLDCKMIKLINAKGNQPWIFIARTDAEAEAPKWPDRKSQLIGKDSDVGKDWRQKYKAQQRIKWIDRIPNSMDMSLSPGDSKGQGILAYTVQGIVESDTT